jgi:TolA-binding protein
METVKQPAFLISSVALAAALGGTIYNHRKISTIQEELTDLNKRLCSTIRRVGEFENNSDGFKELTRVVKEINTIVGQQNKDIRSLTEEIDDIHHRIDAQEQQIQMILQALKDENIPIPTRKSRRSHKQPKQVSFQESPPLLDLASDPPKKRKTKTAEEVSSRRNKSKESDEEDEENSDEDDEVGDIIKSVRGGK